MSFASDIGRMVARGPQRQLNDQESMTLLRLVMLCEEPPEEQVAFYQELVTKSQILNIMHNRFRLHFGDEQTLSPPALIWLSTLADRPGNVILLLAVLAHLKAEGRDFSLNSLLQFCFMKGIPTNVNYQLAWDAQKVNEDRAKTLCLPANGPDNCLDYKEAWQ